MDEQQKIYFWPDGVWCYSEELEEMLEIKSDDFGVLCVDLFMDDYEIEKLVQKRINGIK